MTSTDSVSSPLSRNSPNQVGVRSCFCFFRRAIELQRKHAPPGREFLNGIQTNGTLLDEEWCRFLAEEKFYVGLSIDGPREVHDFYRVDKNDRATHKQTIQAYRMLRRHGVHVDVLCVVNAKNVQQPLDVYRFFKELDVRFLQFLPLVGRLPDGRIRPESVPADAELEAAGATIGAVVVCAEEVFDRAFAIEDELQSVVEFAFHARYGFLTSCPTNVGTGMRVSVMLHLPALSLSKLIEKVFNAVNKLSLAVRGFYGEATEASGDFYQISNQDHPGPLAGRSPGGPGEDDPEGSRLWADRVPVPVGRVLPID